MDKSRFKVSPIETELKNSYLIYALSVIISRALPDLRDGLKPVQRRILYAMYKSGLMHNKKFRKSATVIGSVIGSYHPHGDIPVYEALVRMTQDFSLRYPLIEGQGNFGSVDGDPPAAHRYTECKLSSIGETLLRNIEKNTVEFAPNFDGTKKEPKTLPSPIPLLLLNGASGIAVGLATYIFPHNINEVIDSLVYFIDHQECAITDLLKFIQGPDFPTGGQIISAKTDLINFYQRGQGKVTVRSSYELEENKKIVITSIPYQVNKAETLKKIAALVKDKKLDDIKEIRDESNKKGVRIVFELKKGASANIVLKKLFYFTDLQKTYYGNFVALKNGLEPKILNLKEYYEEFLLYRIETLKKEILFDLEEAKKRVEILEGLKKALDKIDEVIDLIKKSQDREVAKRNLIIFLQINENQANAILEMKLERLARLEQEKILSELKEKLERINQLQKLLNDPHQIEQNIKNDLLSLRNKFKSPRQTEIKISETNQPYTSDVTAYEYLVEKKPNILILTNNNYIKRLDASSIKSQKRGGNGLFQKTKDGVEIRKIIHLASTDDLYLVSNKGKFFKIKTFLIPESQRLKVACPINSLLKLEPNEEIIDLMGLDQKALTNYQHFVFLTQKGLIKKIEITKFKLIKQNGVKIIKLDGDDTLLGFGCAKLKSEILIATRRGIGVHFGLDKVRSQGKTTYGVKSLRLKKQDDQITDFLVINDPSPDSLIFIATDKGYGKMIKLRAVRKINRGGSGVIILKVTSLKGQLAKINNIPNLDSEAMLITKNGMMLRFMAKEVPLLGRNSSGVRIIRLENEDLLKSCTIF